MFDINTNIRKYAQTWYNYGTNIHKYTKICNTNKNKTIKDGDIAPWKDFKKEERKRNQIRPYFEMGRIVKRLHFLR